MTDDTGRRYHRRRYGGADDERAPGAGPPNLSPKFSTGFALMSVVPILLALYLISRPPGEGSIPVVGSQGAIVLLMVASSVAGFVFIRRELSRTFLQILQSASRAASGDLEERIRHASEDEIGKISETIRTITR